jgi:hypothetical protein
MMRHRERGPSKKLAPAPDPESVCPHKYAEEERIILEIDCSDCSGAQDLENTKCLVGVMRIICGGAEPGAVILKRSLHKRYRDNTVSLLRASASELVRLNRALSSTERPSDKRCRTCPASRENVLKTLRRRLLSDPRGYLSNPDRLLGGCSG